MRSRRPWEAKQERARASLLPLVEQLDKVVAELRVEITRDEELRRLRGEAREEGDALDG